MIYVKFRKANFRTYKDEGYDLKTKPNDNKTLKKKKKKLLCNSSCWE